MFDLWVTNVFLIGFVWYSEWLPTCSPGAAIISEGKY